MDRSVLGEGALEPADCGASKREDQVAEYVGRRSTEILLLRQFFAAMLKRYDYMSLPVVGETGLLSVYVFQILDVERRNIIIRPFTDLAERAELDGLYTITLQPLQIWRKSDEMDANELDTMSVFVFDEPAKADIISALGSNVERRRDIFVWQTRVSDVDGCVELYNKERLTERHIDLSSPQAPVLSLIDALSAEGFHGVGEHVVHNAASRAYDNRKLSGRRAYLQCALYFNSRLAAKGVEEFRSVGPAAYFEALLRGKSFVRSGLPALEYKRLLAEERQGDAALEDLEADPGAPRRPVLVADADRPSGQPGHSPPRPIVARPAAPDSESTGSIAGSAPASDDDIAGGGAAPPGGALGGQPVAARGQRRLPDGFPADIQGMRVAFVAGRASASHTYADRVTVRCSNPAHQGCSKSRSLKLLESRFGVRAAELFLGAWLMKAESLDAQAHAKYTPKVADMEAYRASNPGEV